MEASWAQQGPDLRQLGGYLAACWGQIGSSMGQGAEVRQLGAYMSHVAETDTDFIVFGSRNRRNFDGLPGAERAKYVTIVVWNAFSWF